MMGFYTEQLKLKALIIRKFKQDVEETLLNNKYLASGEPVGFIARQKLEGLLRELELGYSPTKEDYALLLGLSPASSSSR